MEYLNAGLVAAVTEIMDLLNIQTRHAVALRLLSYGRDFSADPLRAEIAALLQDDGTMHTAIAEAYLAVYQIRFILQEPAPFA